METQTKKCTKCGRVLPIDEFYACPTATDGHHGACKSCMNAVRRERYAEKRHNKTVFQSESGHTECMKPVNEATPRELLEELKSRGYVWDKMWVQQFVDYAKI